MDSLNVQRVRGKAELPNRKLNPKIDQVFLPIFNVFVILIQQP